MIRSIIGLNLAMALATAAVPTPLQAPPPPPAAASFPPDRGVEIMRMQLEARAIGAPPAMSGSEASALYQRALAPPAATPAAAPAAPLSAPAQP